MARTRISSKRHHHLCARFPSILPKRTAPPPPNLFIQKGNLTKYYRAKFIRSTWILFANAARKQLERELATYEEAVASARRRRTSISFIFRINIVANAKTSKWRKISHTTRGSRGTHFLSDYILGKTFVQFKFIPRARAITRGVVGIKAVSLHHTNALMRDSYEIFCISKTLFCEYIN